MGKLGKLFGTKDKKQEQKKAPVDRTSESYRQDQKRRVEEQRRRLQEKAAKRKLKQKQQDELYEEVSVSIEDTVEHMTPMQRFFHSLGFWLIAPFKLLKEGSLSAKDIVDNYLGLFRPEVGNAQDCKDGLIQKGSSESDYGYYQDILIRLSGIPNDEIKVDSSYVQAAQRDGGIGAKALDFTAKFQVSQALKSSLSPNGLIASGKNKLIQVAMSQFNIDKDSSKVLQWIAAEYMKQPSEMRKDNPQLEDFKDFYMNDLRPKLNVARNTPLRFLHAIGLTNFRTGTLAAVDTALAMELKANNLVK